MTTFSTFADDIMNMMKADREINNVMLNKLDEKTKIFLIDYRGVVLEVKIVWDSDEDEKNYAACTVTVNEPTACPYEHGGLDIIIDDSWYEQVMNKVKNKWIALTLRSVFNDVPDCSDATDGNLADDTVFFQVDHELYQMYLQEYEDNTLSIRSIEDWSADHDYAFDDLVATISNRADALAWATDLADFIRQEEIKRREEDELAEEDARRLEEEYAKEYAEA